MAFSFHNCISLNIIIEQKISLIDLTITKSRNGRENKERKNSIRKKLKMELKFF